MHRENLLVNDGSDWQAVEAVGKRLPQFDVIPPLAWVIQVRKNHTPGGSGGRRAHTRRKSRISC